MKTIESAVITGAGGADEPNVMLDVTDAVPVWPELSVAVNVDSSVDEEAAAGVVGVAAACVDGVAGVEDCARIDGGGATSCGAAPRLNSLSGRAPRQIAGTPP